MQPHVFVCNTRITHARARLCTSSSIVAAQQQQLQPTRDTSWAYSQLVGGCGVGSNNAQVMCAMTMMDQAPMFRGQKQYPTQMQPNWHRAWNAFSHQVGGGGVGSKGEEDLHAFVPVAPAQQTSDAAAPLAQAVERDTGGVEE